MPPSPTTERKARRALRLREARLFLEANGTPPERPYFGECDTAEEVAWIKLGGSLGVFRALQSDDDETAETALRSLTGSGTLSRETGTARTELPTLDERLHEEIRQTLERLGLDPAYAEITRSEAAADITRAKRKLAGD